ncbi:MAG: flagellar assembly protein FliW [Treponemataceae bacterium]|nr:MAG: flagellar assembly protein FliW [Treponemataceae bacterium]
MDVLTKTLGTVEVAEEAKLTFAEGLFGFETVTEYALIKSECEPFFWLQALRDQSLAFLVVDPFLVYKDYEPDIDDKSLDSIGITSPNDILILSIVTIPANGGSPTINLRGPLIINQKAHLCFQAILDSPKWSTKHSIDDGTALRREAC